MYENLPSFLVNPDPSVYLTGTPLFVDFETTTYGRGLALHKQNRIVLASYQYGYDAPIRTVAAGEYEQQELVELCAKADFIVAHNAKFELAWLARCGTELEKVLVYDTMLAEYVIGGNRWQYSQLSLQQTALRHGLEGKDSLVSMMIKAGIDPEDIPLEWLTRYNVQDVALLPQVMKKQLALMEGTRLLPVVYNRCLLVPVLADIERNGLQLDGATTVEECEKLETEFKLVEASLNTIAPGVNFSSPKQVGSYLYDTLGFAEKQVRRGGKWIALRTDAGARKTDYDTIESLDASTELQRQFKDLYLKHRDLSAQLTKYLRKFKTCVEADNGRLYAQFNQTNTQTHRLSSNGLKYGAQFQNFPRQYKRLFRARNSSWMVGECDGAQLEFRVAAHMGRCAAAVADILRGVDVHAFTASVLTAAGQPTERQEAKTHTFKPLYGGQSGTEAEKAYYRAFREKYPGIRDTQQTWIDYVLNNKYLETEWGLRYYWPDTRMDRSGYITNSTSICNYPVQAFATAEIIPIGVVFMWHRLKRMNVRMFMVNTVHDSIIVELPPDEQETFSELARQCLIDDVYYFLDRLYGINLVVPLGCEVKVGTHWGTGKGVKFEAKPGQFKEVSI